MNSITLKACAKLNLSLDITGIRERDGYHFLSTIMQTVDLYDTLTLEKSDSITLNCDCLDIPVDGSNLAMKAAYAFFDYTKLIGGVRIDLIKRIPHGAGMGGGSSDAAAVLKGLDCLYETELSNQELCDIGIKLGADVPFFIYSGIALVTGIGENVVELNELFKCCFLIVKPDFSMSTPQVYKDYDNVEEITHPDVNEIVYAIYNNSKVDFYNNISNVLEAAVDRPEIGEIKAEFMENGAKKSLMTGSGSAVFGIFENEEIAEDCAEKLIEKYSNVYLCHSCKE